MVRRAVGPTGFGLAGGGSLRGDERRDARAVACPGPALRYGEGLARPHEVTDRDRCAAYADGSTKLQSSRAPDCRSAAERGRGDDPNAASKAAAAPSGEPAPLCRGRPSAVRVRGAPAGGGAAPGRPADQPQDAPIVPPLRVNSSRAGLPAFGAAAARGLPEPIRRLPPRRVTSAINLRSQAAAQTFRREERTDFVLKFLGESP